MLSNLFTSDSSFSRNGKSFSLTTGVNSDWLNFTAIEYRCHYVTPRHSFQINAACWSSLKEMCNVLPRKLWSLCLIIISCCQSFIHSILVYPGQDYGGSGIYAWNTGHVMGINLTSQQEAFYFFQYTGYSIDVNCDTVTILFWSRSCLIWSLSHEYWVWYFIVMHLGYNPSPSHGTLFHTFG